MNDFPANPNPATVGPTNRELQNEIQALRGLVLGVITITIALSGALNLYFLRQASVVRGQLAENEKYIAEFTTGVQPKIEGLMAQLNAFARTNADFAVVLSKYSINPTPGSAPAGNPPAVAPTAAKPAAPAVAPRPAK